MTQDKIKKARWYSTIIFDNNVSISQFVYSKDVVKFTKSLNKSISSNLDRQHSYVLPYIFNEAKIQNSKVKSITIREIEYHDD